jgi:hypothetical protein
MPLTGSQTTASELPEDNQVHIVLRVVPILNCFEDSLFVASILLIHAIAVLMGAFNAMIPTYKRE